MLKLIKDLNCGFETAVKIINITITDLEIPLTTEGIQKLE
jgi:hypothetical protein